ncbi:MAG TPA: hypothetical protein VMH30_15325 [Verrucomicrobiae bacterium]|nr:hypothetical protein [Verrucomicrobiae bacterium]
MLQAGQSTIEYEFKLRDGTTKQFFVRLQKPSLHFITEHTTMVRHWTKLTHHQCPNCPLSPETHHHCPIALNLVDVIESFKDSLSIEEAEIIIRSESREYHKRSTVQYGIGSLMGLYMVTSGCPIMDKLRPMVYTHLPFSSLEETLYRAASMYLFAQYFRARDGGTPDWKLEDFAKIYEAIATVNQSFTKRLLSINPRDASLNALVGLDCFASAAAFSTIEENLQEFEPLFEAYMQKGDSMRRSFRDNNRI